MLKKLYGAGTEWHLVSQVQVAGSISSLSLLCTGELLLVGTTLGKMYQVDTNTFQVVDLATSHIQAITNCIFPRVSSHYCSTISRDGSVRVWDLSTYQVLGSVFEACLGLSLVFTIDDSLILTGWSDGWIRAYQNPSMVIKYSCTLLVLIKSRKKHGILPMPIAGKSIPLMPMTNLL